MPFERPGIEVRVFRSHAEADAADKEWWLRIPPNERVELARRLSQELYGMKVELPSDHNFEYFLRAFSVQGVRFLVVGAYALALHGHPRATGDLNVWVEPTPENAARVVAALCAFGAPMSSVTEEDFAAPGMVHQFGLPPGRIDILTKLSGHDFAEAWKTRLLGLMGPCEVPFLDRESFIRNKRAAGRPKDMVDADALE